ncbi:MAG: hypothetical protein ACR2N4_04890 [Jatrophihabitans sp.]
MSTADLPPRRRRRAQRPAGPPVSAEQQAAATGRSDEPAAPASPRTRKQGGRRGSRTGDPSPQHGRDADRGWRELAGSTPSQLGLSGALRARDVARPGPAELAAAERDLEIVRRQWQPPADDPPIGR